MLGVARAAARMFFGCFQDGTATCRCAARARADEPDGGISTDSGSGRRFYPKWHCYLDIRGIGIRNSSDDHTGGPMKHAAPGCHVDRHNRAVLELRRKRSIAQRLKTGRPRPKEPAPVSPANSISQAGFCNPFMVLLHCVRLR